MDKINVIIAGDYCPHDRVETLLEDNDFLEVFSNISPVLETVDYSIVNFETTVASKEDNSISKYGPSLRCSSIALDAIKYAGFNAITLANNHFYDYGDAGVQNTITACQGLDLDCVGGGKNLEDAQRILYKDIKNKRIAIINFCENEFSIASDVTGGAAPLNPIINYYQIQKAKEYADVIIVIVHGGHEFYQLPSPRMQEIYRYFIDVGADVVVNHHQHCYSGYEKYKNRYIFYGIGNFCFDWEGECLKWREGYMVKLQFSHEDIDIQLYPYVQGGEKPGVFLMDEAQKNIFFERVKELNLIIGDKKRLRDCHEEFMESRRKNILVLFEPYINKYLVALYSRDLLPSLLNTSKLCMIKNYVMCESHRDIVEYILKSKI